MAVETSTIITTVISTVSGFIAILGGFLVSRLIAIYTEKNVIKAALEEMRNTKNRNNSEIEKMNTNYNNYIKDKFFIESYRQILIDQESFESLSEDYTDEEKKQVKEMYDLIIQIYKHISKHFTYEDNPDDRDQDYPANWEEFIQRTRFEYKKQYNTMYEHIYYIVDPLTNKDSNYLDSMYYLFKDTYLQYEPTTESIEELAQENQYLQVQIKDRESQLAALIYPNDIFTGIIFLVCWLLVGITIPMHYLISDPCTYPANINIILSAFLHFVIITFIGYLLYLFIKYKKV